MEFELFAELKKDIESLYKKMGSPDELANEHIRTTTGNSDEPFWTSSDIGDWDGHEELVAEWANAQYEEILSLSGNSGIHYYNTTPEWDAFAEEAKKLIDEDLTTAFERLCEGLDVNELLAEQSQGMNPA